MPYRNQFVTIAALVLSTAALGASNKPNVVFILADDLGYGDFSHAGEQGADTALRSLGQALFGVRWQAQRDTVFAPSHPKRRRRFALPAHSKQKEAGHSCPAPGVYSPFG